MGVGTPLCWGQPGGQSLCRGCEVGDSSRTAPGAPSPGSARAVGLGMALRTLLCRVMGLGTAQGTLLCKGSGPGDSHGDPPQLVRGTALGPLSVLWLRMGLWAWGQPWGLPSAQGCVWGLCLPEVQGWGTLLGTSQTHTTAVDVGLKDGSLWTPFLRCGAGGQSYRPLHPRNIPGILMNSVTGAWGQGHPASPLPEVDTFGGVLGDYLC